MDRIDKLIAQATHDCMGVDVLDRREFAELIIRECGTALNLPLRDMISRGQAYSLIQQHFGIKTDR
jgi:hypothetical protein